MDIDKISYLVQGYRDNQVMVEQKYFEQRRVLFQMNIEQIHCKMDMDQNAQFTTAVFRGYGTKQL